MNAKKVKDLIGNELWNATNTANVKLGDFENAEAAIQKIKTAEEKADFRELCAQDTSDENVKSPLIPRYLRSVLGKHPVDDRFIFSVFDEYFHDSKWNEVFYLGNKILTFNESPYILRALAESYEIKGDEENKVKMWERLIKADHNETEVFYKFAKYYEEAGDQQQAFNCYHRAILRHINASQLDSVKTLWPKVSALRGDNSVYLTQLAERIARAMGNYLGVQFLMEVYEQGDFDLNSKIHILKTILDFDNDNLQAAEQIAKLFREKYSDNPRLEYCLENTGLTHSYMNSNLAVQKFEKEIQFVENAFVWHNSWKLGRIKSIEKDQMFIQFMTRKDLHKMSCDMAFTSLRVLPKQHIWVLKAGAKPEAIKERLMANTEWGLRMLLTSFNGSASLKQIKEELVPSVLNESEWSTWQSAAKKELASNPYFGLSDSNMNEYVLRESPITYEEKEYQLFQREKSFFGKYGVMKDFIKNDGDLDSEEFIKILNYFEKEVEQNSTNAICALLILNYCKKKLGMAFIHSNVEFQDIYNELDSARRADVYGSIEDAELRKLYVESVVEYDPSWQASLADLLHVNPSVQLLEMIEEGPKKRIMSDILSEAVQNCQADSDLALFFFRNYTEEDWKKARYSADEILESKLSLLIYVSGKVAHNVDTQDNKARQKLLIEDLFRKNPITDYLKSCGTAEARRVYSYISNVPGLEEKYVLEVKHVILSTRSDAKEVLDIKAEPAAARLIPKGFLCTRAMFVAKTAELEHIMNVEIPENSREIGVARDLGDLRENAEYQYAKDKQTNLNAMMNKLTDEIDMAKIIEKEDVDTSFVEFGTKTVFTDNLNGGKMVQTLLGPWESNPEKNILNFQAPLGQKIYNMTVGENRKFEINGVRYDLTVDSIELADF